MKQNTQYGEVSLTVVIDGKELEELSHGDGKTYVASETSKPYSIVIGNGTSGRVEVLLAVDGINILHPESKRGYVLEPNARVKFIGFQTDNESAARFTFETPEQSHAASLGKVSDIGTIRAEFFSPDPCPLPPMCGISGPSAGTSYGIREDFRIVPVRFVRESAHPFSILTLSYHTPERLKEMGVGM